MSQISPLTILKVIFSRKHLLKKTPQRTKTLVSPVWNKILKIWDTLSELIQIKVQCSKNYFRRTFFLSEEAGASGNNIVKEPHPKLKKYVYDKFTDNIFAACNPIQVVVLCKNV